MLSSGRILAGRLARPAARRIPLQASVSQVRCISQGELEDPNMNNNYPNPPAEKRQFRDPYGKWWDKQERRDFGEPVHEDNDILGVFSPEVHTHYKPGKGLFLIGCWVATFLGVCGVVRLTYPDKPSVPRTFPNGLEKELGGPGAVSAPKHGDY